MDTIKILRVIFLEDLLFSKDWMLLHIINRMNNYMHINDVIYFKLAILERYESESVSIELVDNPDSGGFNILDLIKQKPITTQKDFINKQPQSILNDIFKLFFEKYPNLIYTFLVDINPNLSMIHTDPGVLLVYNNDDWDEFHYLKSMIFPNTYHKMEFIDKKDFWKIYAKYVIPEKQGLRMSIFSAHPIDEFLFGLDKYILEGQKELIEIEYIILNETTKNKEYLKELEEKVVNGEKVISTGMVKLWDPNLINQFTNRDIYKNIK